jgi:pimeloyl-ACP methyl ester carboxylesterase
MLILDSKGVFTNKNAKLYDYLSSHLNKELQLTVVRFDFRGAGSSPGVTNYSNYDEEVEDLRTVVEWVRNERKQKVVAIIGHSRGGNIVLMYASKFNDVGSVVNICGRFNMKNIINKHSEEERRKLETEGGFFMDIKGKPFYVSREDVVRAMEIDMHQVVGKINATGTTRILTAHGTADKVIPFDDAKDLSATMDSNKLVHQLYPVDGADHSFTKEPFLKALGEGIVNWLKPPSMM